MVDAERPVFSVASAMVMNGVSMEGTIHTTEDFVKSGEEKVVDRYLETIFECDDRTHFAWIDNNIHRKIKSVRRRSHFSL